MALALALAFPDRLSRRRDATGENWQSVGGRGFRLDPASPLARSQWLAVAEVAGRASGARILSAAAIEEADVHALFADRIETRHEAEFDAASGSVTPVRLRRLGAIRLASGPDPQPDQAAIERALLDGVRTHGPALLPWSESAIRLRQRVNFARHHDNSLPSLEDEALLERVDEWLPPLLAGRRRLADIGSGEIVSALQALLGYDACRRVDRLAATDFKSPAGSTHPIDYGATGGPSVEVRAQALFGLAEHPMVAEGRVPLTLLVTSPAGRPIQTTRDLPEFWRGSWREVVKEMRGRYPRHFWPDDPATAPATLRTKRAEQRNR